METCRECGKELLSADDKFCHGCGAKVQSMAELAVGQDEDEDEEFTEWAELCDSGKYDEALQWCKRLASSEFCITACAAASLANRTLNGEQAM